MQRRPLAFALALLPLAAACAAGAGSGSSAPGRLAITVPQGGSAAYTQVDSAVISVDAGGQMIDVNAVTHQVLDMTFSRAPGAVEVTATWRELDAVVSNPMGAPERADIDDVEGSLVFTLDPRGAATVVTKPDLRGTAVQMVDPATVAHGFFPRLPGTPPTPGMTWTDTIAYESDSGEASSQVRSIITYTVVGDTVVDGRSLLRVDTEGSDERTAEGTTAGMDFVQNVSGTVEGFFLWDLAAGKLHTQFTESDMSGTMELAAAPFPLGVAMRASSLVTPAGN